MKNLQLILAFIFMSGVSFSESKNESDDPSKTGWAITGLPDVNLRADIANNFAIKNLADRALVIKFKNTKIKSLYSARSSAVGIGSVEMDPDQAYRHLDFKLTDPAFIADLTDMISESNLITDQDKYKSGDYLFVWTCTKNTKYRKTFVVWIVYTRRIKLIIHKANDLAKTNNSTTVNMQSLIAGCIPLIDVDTAIDWSDTLKSKIKTNAELLDEFKNNIPKFHKMKQAKVDDAEDEAEEDANIIKISSKIRKKVDIINNQNSFWLECEIKDAEFKTSRHEFDVLYYTYDLVKKKKTLVFTYNGENSLDELDKIKSNLILTTPVDSTNSVSVFPKSLGEERWYKTKDHFIYKHEKQVAYIDIKSLGTIVAARIAGKWDLPAVVVINKIIESIDLNLNTKTIYADPSIILYNKKY